MIRLVVTTHGNLATALVDTARLVVSTSGPVIAINIEGQDDSATYEAHLRQAIEDAEGGTGVLVLTDMFGGTPSNVGMTLHVPGAVEVLTGVNLPMLIKAIQLSSRDLSLSKVAREVWAAGQRSIAVASELLGLPKETTVSQKERGA